MNSTWYYMLIIGSDSFNETLNAHMLVDDRCMSRMRMAAGACDKPTVRGEGPGRAAQRAAAARPVNTRPAALACHVPEAVHQQGRRSTPRHRITHLCLIRSCRIHHCLNQRLSICAHGYIKKHRCSAPLSINLVRK